LKQHLSAHAIAAILGLSVSLLPQTGKTEGIQRPQFANDQAQVIANGRLVQTGWSQYWHPFWCQGVLSAAAESIWLVQQSRGW
jgi:hypothetical protein